MHKHVIIIAGWHDYNMLMGFCRYAHEAGWTLNTVSIFQSAVPRRWQADGLLTTNVFRPDLRRFVRKAAAVMPAVLHGCDDLRLGIPRVECDEAAIGRLAAEHLLDQGHKNFVFFSHSDALHARRRLDGFRARLRAAQRDCLVLSKISATSAGLADWLAGQLKHLPKPVGLFAVDDLLASEAIEAALDGGWRVPEDMAVLGVGNNDLVCQYSQIPITSIGQPMEQQAYAAAALLDRLMHGRPAPKAPVVLPPSGLITRMSTDHLAVTHPAVKRAVEFMMEHLVAGPLTSRQIAQAIGISITLLFRLFHRELACTPSNLIQRFRIRRARDLMLTTSEKISAISERCGFLNLRTFQRTFIRLEGLHPQAWRQAQREKFQPRFEPRLFTGG